MDEVRYRNLWACYRSGQITERQWLDHLKDLSLARWVDAQNAK